MPQGNRAWVHCNTSELWTINLLTVFTVWTSTQAAIVICVLQRTVNITEIVSTQVCVCTIHTVNTLYQCITVLTPWICLVELHPVSIVGSYVRDSALCPRLPAGLCPATFRPCDHILVFLLQLPPILSNLLLSPCLVLIRASCAGLPFIIVYKPHYDYCHMTPATAPYI